MNEVSVGPASSLGYALSDGLGDGPFDVAVVIPTVARISIKRALESVFAQTDAGRIQIAIGVDVAKGDVDVVRQTLECRPPNVSALVLTLPYSTSMRHGGVHTRAGWW